jgi:hypothetical protein
MPWFVLIGNERYEQHYYRNQTDRNGWKVFEAPRVEPVFPEKRQAISYAQERAGFRSGEIRILDSSGAHRRGLSSSRQGIIAL